MTMQVGDIGTIVRLTIEDDGAALNVSSASTKQIIFRPPTQDAAAVTKTADFSTDGTDGKLQYQLLSGDLDVAGRWRVQARVVLVTGTWFSTVAEFVVEENV